MLYVIYDSLEEEKFLKAQVWNICDLFQGPELGLFISEGGGVGTIYVKYTWSYTKMADQC